MPKDTPSRITPPRPMNCFLLYRNDMQKEILAKCKGANHRDISKIIAKWWREESEELKKSYRLKAMKEKEEHQKKYPGYRYCPKKKVGSKRGYTRRNMGTIFTSRTEENNKLMESMYMREGSSKSPEREGARRAVKIEEQDSGALLAEAPKSDSLPPPTVKKSPHLACSSRRRSRHSSAPLMLGYQDSPYVHSALSSKNSSSLSSSSSVGCESPFKTPSPPVTYRTMPYMQPAVSSFNTSNQDPFYAAYYDPTRQTYVYSSSYVHQNYTQPLHPNVASCSSLLFTSYSAPQYLAPSAAYHAPLNYLHVAPSYAAPVSTADCEYGKECDGCINPLLLGMP